MTAIVAGIAVLGAWGAWMARAAPRFLHLFQLDGYRYDRLRLHLGREGARWRILAARRAPPPKKPLVWTARARRILAVALGLQAAAIVGALLVAWPLAAPVAAVGFVALPETLGLANGLLAPLQRAESRRWVGRARRRLEEVGPLVVGISGAFGKTSTKTALAPLLDGRYPTLATPGSYNTLLGLARTVNEHLAPTHAAFLAEMGAYRPGDIAELCDFVRPRHGILCRLGPVHLERFGSVEAIVATERELLVALPPGGIGVVHAVDAERHAVLGDDLRCRIRLVHRAPPAGGASADAVVIGAVAPSARGTAFTVDFGDGEGPVAFDTPLLGDHSVENVVAALALADALGVPRAWLRQAVTRLQPAEHRLQLHRRPGGVTVLDDTYNSNPDGAAAALSVLASRPARRRIVVTPGMIELGSREAEENRAFGRRAGEVADAVLVVGAAPRVAPLLEGARQGGTATVVERFDTLTDATTALRRLVVPETTVLFENDLPDNYDVVRVVAG